MKYESVPGEARELFKIGFDDFVEAAVGVQFGDGGEDATALALDKISQKLSESGKLPHFIGSYNIIPDPTSYILMEGATERLKIT